VNNSHYTGVEDYDYTKKKRSLKNEFTFYSKYAMRDLFFTNASDWRSAVVK
jgi:hypothetical protein